MRSHLIILLSILAIALCTRLFQLGFVPVSLHGDEVGVGYNSYTLLTAGVDEYGKRLPLVFRADVGPIIYYATVPSIALFGLTEFGTRFPAVVVGTITLITFYYLLQELWRFFYPNFSKSERTKISLLGTLLLTLSPWHIQISRIAHDGSYGLLLQFIALLAFFVFLRTKNLLFLYFSSLFFSFSFYAYHAPRLTSPLFFLGLLILGRRSIKFRQAVTAFLILLLVVSPLAVDFVSKPLSQTRFGGINIFVGRTWSLSNFIQWPLLFLGNFIKQFDLKALFFDSSQTRYFHVAGVGLVHLWYILTLFLGFMLLWRNQRFFKFIFFWLVISVLPGGLTQGPANAGRIVLLFPALEIVSGLGIFSCLKPKKSAKFLTVIVLVSALTVANFLKQYFYDSPQRFEKQWQGGVKRIVQSALNQENTMNKIIFSENIKQAYIYVLFYGRKSISQVLTAVPRPERHQLVGYTRFGKYEFRKIDWEKDRSLSNALVFGLTDEIPQSKQTEIFTSFRGETLFVGSRL